MRLIRHLLAACLATVIAACGGGSGGGGGDNEVALRILHASPDSPLVNVLVDNRLIAGSVDYRQGTAFILLTARAYDIAVEIQKSDGNERVIDLVDLDLVAGNQYTVLAVGSLADDDVGELVITNPVEGAQAGNFRVQVVHGAPGGPDVDVYVTPNGADLAGATPVATLAYRDVSLRQNLPAGEQQIRITPAGDSGTLLYDSGAVTLDDRDDLLLVAVPNAGTGPAPLTLMVNDGFSSSQLFDVGTQAEIRVLNLSPNAPPIQVSADPADDDPVVNLTAAFPTGLAFPDSTAYQPLEAKEYKFTALDAADGTTKRFERTQVLLQNQRLTLAAVGLLANIAPVVLFDDVRPVATEGKLRIINGAPAKTSVDVYVTTPGQDLNSASPLLRNVGLGVASNYLSLAPGNYQISVTDPGTKTVVVTTTTPLAAGSAFTVIIRDNAGGGTPLGIELENDLP